MTIPSVVPVLHHVRIVQPDMAAADDYMALFGYEETTEATSNSSNAGAFFLRLRLGIGD